MKKGSNSAQPKGVVKPPPPPGPPKVCTCTRIPPAGYSGQKYSIFCRDGNDKDMLVGWTNRSDGGALVHMINKHPVWHDPKIIENE